MNELQGDKFQCSCPLFRRIPMEKGSGGLGKPLAKDRDGKGDGKGMLGAAGAEVDVQNRGAAAQGSDSYTSAPFPCLIT